jgi:hypothetical protein
MHSSRSEISTLSRRSLFQHAGAGIGAVALVDLLRQESAGNGREASSVVGDTHHPPRAKSVIYIHLVGAPSHLDLFDPKPELQKRTGELCPD